MDSSGSSRERMPASRGPRLLIAVVACGVVVWLLFRYVITDPGLVLEYLKVLAWPAVVAIALFWLRMPLRDKLRELLRAEGFGTSFEFQERVTRRLEAELAGPFDQLGATGSDGSEQEALDVDSDEEVSRMPPAAAASEVEAAESGAAAESPVTESAATGAMATGAVEPLDDLEAIAAALGIPQVIAEKARQRFNSEPEEARRRFLETILTTAGHDRSIRNRNVKQRADTREGIEAVIRKSAEWGYEMGRAGAPKTVPDVEWNDDGSWRIVTEVPKRRTQLQRWDAGDSLRQVRALEKEIKKLERQKHSGVASIGLDTLGNRGWLRELKLKLAKIDPGNPWAD